MVGWAGGHGLPKVFKIVGCSEILIVRNFAVGKDRGFEFNQKIFGLGPPTLQVP